MLSRRYSFPDKIWGALSVGMAEQKGLSPAVFPKSLSKSYIFEADAYIFCYFSI